MRHHGLYVYITLILLLPLYGCFVSQEYIASDTEGEGEFLEDLSPAEYAEIEERIYESSLSRDEPFPPDFPKTIWPEFEHSGKMVFQYRGNINISVETKASIEEVLAIFSTHLKDTGWEAKPLSEKEKTEFLNSFSEDELKNFPLPLRFTLADAEVNVSVMKFGGTLVHCSLDFTNAKLKQAYQEKMNLLSDAFGEEEESAVKLFEQVKARYATCKNYRDTGTHIEYDDTAMASIFDMGEFMHSYERASGNLRFEYLSLDTLVNRVILHHTNQKTTTVVAGRETIQDSLRAGMIEILYSEGDTSALLIPLLLGNAFKEPNEDFSALTAPLERLHFVDDAEMPEGKSFRVIAGVNDIGITYTLWIDDALLIHKIQTRLLDPEGSFISVYTFNPEMDVNFTGRELDLHPEGYIPAPKELHPGLQGLVDVFTG